MAAVSIVQLGGEAGADSAQESAPAAIVASRYAANALPREVGFAQRMQSADQNPAVGSATAASAQPPLPPAWLAARGGATAPARQKAVIVPRRSGNRLTSRLAIDVAVAPAHDDQDPVQHLFVPVGATAGSLAISQANPSGAEAGVADARGHRTAPAVIQR